GGGGRLAAALRAPRRAPGTRRRVPAGLARDPVAAQQPVAGQRLRHGPAGHPVSAAGRRAGPGQDLGGPALLRAVVLRVDGAAGGTGAVRPAGALAARPALEGDGTAA